MWKDNIKMDLAAIVFGIVEWIVLTQDRDKWRALVNAVMNLRALENAGKLSGCYKTTGLSSSVQLHRIIFLVNYLCCCDVFILTSVLL
jgi:hypothetical protein